MLSKGAYVFLAASLAVFVLTLSAVSVAPGVAAQESGSASGNVSGPVDVSTDIRFENDVRAGEETTLVPVVTVEKTPISAVVSVDLTMSVNGDEIETQSFEERISEGTVIRRGFTHSFESPGTKRVEFRGVFSALGQEVSGTVTEEVTVLAMDSSEETDRSTGGGSGSDSQETEETPNTDKGGNRDGTEQDQDGGKEGGETNGADERSQGEAPDDESTESEEDSETETEKRGNTTVPGTDSGTNKAKEDAEAADSTDEDTHQNGSEEQDKGPGVSVKDGEDVAANGSTSDTTARNPDSDSNSDARNGDGQERRLPGFTAGFAVVALIAATLYARYR